MFAMSMFKQKEKAKKTLQKEGKKGILMHRIPSKRFDFISQHRAKAGRGCGSSLYTYHILSIALQNGVLHLYLKDTFSIRCHTRGLILNKKFIYRYKTSIGKSRQFHIGSILCESIFFMRCVCNFMDNDTSSPSKNDPTTVD